MYLRIVSKYLITSVLILFMFSCGGGGVGGVQDSCAKDPKWYSNEECPRNHLCGFGSAGSGNKSTAEFKSKSLARNDLAAAVSQVVIRELTSGFEELEGDAAEAWEKMLNSDNFVTSVNREVTNSIVDQKENAVCDGKNWYWASVKKDIDGVNYAKIFSDAAVQLSESDQEYISATKDWAADKLGNR